MILLTNLFLELTILPLNLHHLVLHILHPDHQLLILLFQIFSHLSGISQMVLKQERKILGTFLHDIGNTAHFTYDVPLVKLV